MSERNRPEDYAEAQMFLDANQAKRMIDEREPGRLRKNNPVIYAAELIHREPFCDFSEFAEELER
jgi:hypothetical protein